MDLSSVLDVKTELFLKIKINFTKMKLNYNLTSIDFNSI